MAEFQNSHCGEVAGRAATWLLAWEPPGPVNTDLASLGYGGSCVRRAVHLNPGDQMQELLKCYMLPG